jgi:hypothetical protein
MITSEFLSPLLDMPPGVILFFALGIGIVAFAGVFLLEAVLLMLIGWGSIWRSLLDPFLVNLGTTVLGFLLAPLGHSFEVLLGLLYKLVFWPVIALIRIITGKTYHQAVFLSEVTTQASCPTGLGSQM